MCLWRMLQAILHWDAIMSGTQKKQEKWRKKTKQRSLSSLAPMNQSFQENWQAVSYYITIIFLSCFCNKTPASDVSVLLSFQESPWKQSRACDWTLRAAPELYFEEETTEPQIMLYSPLVSTTVIRFSLCETLEKDCRFSSEQRTWQWLHTGHFRGAWDICKKPDGD